MTERTFTIARRNFLIGGAMMLTAAGAFAAKPRRSENRLVNAKLSDLIARQVGPWRITTPAGIVVANDEEPTNTEGYDQLLTRTYRADNLPTIMLLIAFGSTQGGSMQLHRPETCYPGQGFKLAQFKETAFPFVSGTPVNARWFTAQRDDRIERLVYWTRIGHSFPRNTAEEYHAIITSVLTGIVPDGILVRLSTIGVNNEEADAALTRFAQEMIATARPLGRQIVLGTP
ncbi:exosortase C-terminal domain/associated protein EpsI [uncultured Sphingomonas sp.]|uniref:exosortase C-terminal domain/associated protein EpsI n=1 Tax=uncultured Sphingomonas sp. TaxID=158754 RepID=UPI0035CADC1A